MDLTHSRRDFAVLLPFDNDARRRVELEKKEGQGNRSQGAVPIFAAPATLFCKIA
jgi:hypothetical protein